MVQVTSCELAFIKTDRKAIQNHPSKAIASFQNAHTGILSLTDISST